MLITVPAKPSQWSSKDTCVWNNMVKQGRILRHLFKMYLLGIGHGCFGGSVWHACFSSMELLCLWSRVPQKSHPLPTTVLVFVRPIVTLRRAAGAVIPAGCWYCRVVKAMPECAAGRYHRWNSHGCEILANFLSLFVDQTRTVRTKVACLVF
jgi:hypothetical protein